MSLGVVLDSAANVSVLDAKVETWSLHPNAVKAWSTATLMQEAALREYIRKALTDFHVEDSDLLWVCNKDISFALDWDAATICDVIPHASRLKADQLFITDSALSAAAAIKRIPKESVGEVIKKDLATRDNTISTAYKQKDRMVRFYKTEYLLYTVDFFHTSIINIRLKEEKALECGFSCRLDPRTVWIRPFVAREFAERRRLNPGESLRTLRRQLSLIKNEEIAPAAGAKSWRAYFHSGNIILLNQTQTALEWAGPVSNETVKLLDTMPVVVGEGPIWTTKDVRELTYYDADAVRDDLYEAEVVDGVATGTLFSARLDMGNRRIIELTALTPSA